MTNVSEASHVGEAVARVGARAGTFAQYAGAALSLTLIAGVGIWGYKLLVRDVTGIPVVRAMEGPMRAAPANPGGDIALHTGLAVNSVAAVGEAAPPEDRLLLAPPQMELLPEDLIAAPAVAAADADMPLPEDGSVMAALEMDGTSDAGLYALTLSDTLSGAGQSTPVEPAPLTAEEVLALADQIAAGFTVGLSEPMQEDAAIEEDAAFVEVVPVQDDAAAESSAVGLPGIQAAAAFPEDDDAEGFAGLVATTVPGVARSLRPSLRPTAAFAAVIATSTPAQAANVASARLVPTPVSVNTSEIAVGTNLVQLGAFESAEIAGQEWDRLRGRFSAFMAGKDRVIQQASSGGRTFYRLRAMGFDDVSDARRFCSALVAENAACIPVVVR